MDLEFQKNQFFGSCIFNFCFSFFFLISVFKKNGFRYDVEGSMMMMIVEFQLDEKWLIFLEFFSLWVFFNTIFPCITR